ncbi:MAG: DUF4389 domain-containing protein [Deltaproteobacteria bacterium]|nr:DUF4389 domain-containing protein [Deltaproteobacteria bacterium]
MQEDATPIERKETGVRILLSLLFGVIAHVVGTVLGVVVLFELAFALITKRPPSERVTHFANRTLSYLYRVVRYLTYNEPEPPFPFSDFPAAMEPSARLDEGRATAKAEAQERLEP